MREIKFRAWLDKSRMNFSGDTYGDFLDFFTICRQCNDGFGNCYLMQFTGLLDKNGKEIYEGDIIRLPEWKDRNGDIEKEEIGDVHWEESTARFTSRVGGQFIPNGLCEIIGNIYENAELRRDLSQLEVK